MNKNKNQEFDQQIKDQIHSSVKTKYPSDDTKSHIDSKIEKIQMEQGGFEMKTFSKMRLATVLAICIAFLGVGTYAIGTITGTISSSPSHYNYTKYEDVKKAQKKAGFEGVIPERLAHGFTFDGVRLGDTADIDDEGNKLHARKTIEVTYKNDQGQSVELNLDKASTDQTLLEESYQEKMEINGHKFYFTQLESLFVADESQLLPQDKARMEQDPFFNVAYGGEGKERSTMVSQHLQFEDQGIQYRLFTPDSISSDTLFDIGAEFFQ